MEGGSVLSVESDNKKPVVMKASIPKALITTAPWIIKALIIKAFIVRILAAKLMIVRLYMIVIALIGKYMLYSAFFYCDNQQENNWMSNLSFSVIS